MQAELHAERVDVIGDRAQAVGELGRVGIPIADSARPAQIHDEELDTDSGSGIGVAPQQLFAELLSVRPRVPGDVGEGGGVRRRFGQNRLGEALRTEARFIPIAVEETEKGVGRLEFVEGVHGMVEVQDRGAELHVALGAILLDGGFGAAIELPAGEEAALIAVPQRHPAALLPIGAGVDFHGGTAGIEQALERLKILDLGGHAPLVHAECGVALAQIGEGPRHHVDPGDMVGGGGQVLVLEAVAQHRLLVVHLEDHGDLRAAF